MALPVALQLFSVGGDMGKDMIGTLRAVKGMGYSGVEFAGLFGRSAKEVRDIVTILDLVPISAHVSLGEMLDNPEKVFETYREIGCEYIVVPYMPDERRPGKPKFWETLKDIERIGTLSAQYGLTMLYHNHDFEFDKIDGKYGLDVMYDTIPASALQSELDVCWVNVGGENPCNYLRKYAGRAPVVHLKDFYGVRNDNMYELLGVESKKAPRPTNFEFRPIGYGMQTIPDILAAANDAGTKWLVVEQDCPSLGLDPMGCARLSRSYLASLGY